MMNRLGRAAVYVGAALMLAACGTTSCDKPEPFQSAQEGDGLRVPGDLTSPTGSGKFAIPDAGREKPVRGPCGDKPPLRKVAVKPPAPPPTPPGVPVPLPLPTTDVDLTPGSGGAPLATGTLESDVRDTVIAWVKAWRAADSASLIQSYSEDFQPPIDGDTRAAWAAKRSTLLEQTGPADVRYDLLKITETYAGANARFIQEFHNGGQINALVKELDFAFSDGRWLIVRERVVEVL